jgi:hypothetical protein
MDIIARLRRWTHDANAVPASDLMDEAAAEIELLREAIRRLADQDATLSVCDGNVTVTMDGPCPYVVGKTTLHCSLTPLTLTTKEREAIDEAVNFYGGVEEDARCQTLAVTLRGLLDRTQDHEKCN